MCQNLTSTELVDLIEVSVAQQARELHGRNIDPHLAAIVVGTDSRFVELKQRRGHTLGVETSIYRLPATSQIADITSIIGFLNVDPSVHGILIQLPLPDFTTEQIDQIINTIAPEKDVDGLRADSPFQPTTAQAMLQLAEHYKIDLTDCVIVGRGRLVGSPLHRLLDKQKIAHQVVDLNTKDGAKVIAQAKVILSGTDTLKPIFDRTTVRKDVAIIAAGNEIDHDDLDNWASALTPARGGVGPLTITLLLQQTVTAAKHG